MFNEIFKQAKDALLLPFFRRTASNLGTVLATVGFQAGEIETLEAAAVIVGGFAIDLLLSRINAHKVVQNWGKN